MDLRYRPRARTTKDIDLSVPLAVAGGAGELRDRLQAASDRDLGDYLVYRIGEPRAEIANAPEGGGRYPCEALLVGKTHAKLHIDVGVGDAAFGEPERLTGEDLLDFAGIAPAIALAIPKAQRFAEKIHAYTYPWEGRVNTRTKDLVDLVLLIGRGGVEAAAIRGALATTFATRGTHELPGTLAPPPSWARLHADGTGSGARRFGPRRGVRRARPVLRGARPRRAMNERAAGAQGARSPSSTSAGPSSTRSACDLRMKARASGDHSAGFSG